MTSSHSFHSLEAEKGPISFTFGHTHTGMVDTKSPPGVEPFLRPTFDLDWVVCPGLKVLSGLRYPFGEL